ncbi:hypothetical protein [Haloterrigena salifodinae]|uniref:hypothetical protein n=1 Tax=Haloterrigena salifodinae TaxID=2675099 RepID=UPI001B87E8E6|nr:hypothetical protein [Haloterrigena salifodinae]
MDTEDKEILRILTDSTNSEILTALTDAPRGLSVTELAEQLVSGEETELKQTIISLHHNYLPRLDEACLPYAENAIERGVDLHAGTKNRDAREASSGR